MLSMNYVSNAKHCEISLFTRSLQDPDNYRVACLYVQLDLEDDNDEEEEDEGEEEDQTASKSWWQQCQGEVFLAPVTDSGGGANVDLNACAGTVFALVNSSNDVTTENGNVDLNAAGDDVSDTLSMLFRAFSEAAKLNPSEEEDGAGEFYFNEDDSEDDGDDDGAKEEEEGVSTLSSFQAELLPVSPEGFMILTETQEERLQRWETLLEDGAQKPQ